MWLIGTETRDIKYEWMSQRRATPGLVYFWNTVIIWRFTYGDFNTKNNNGNWEIAPLGCDVRLWWSIAGENKVKTLKNLVASRLMVTTPSILSLKCIQLNIGQIGFANFYIMFYLSFTQRPKPPELGCRSPKLLTEIGKVMGFPGTKYFGCPQPCICCTCSEDGLEGMMGTLKRGQQNAENNSKAVHYWPNYKKVSGLINGSAFPCLNWSWKLMLAVKQSL